MQATGEALGRPAAGVWGPMATGHGAGGAGRGVAAERRAVFRAPAPVWVPNLGPRTPNRPLQGCARAWAPSRAR